MANSRHSRRRRGEAQVEYVIIGLIISACSVTSLLVAGAGGLRRVAKASELCVIEHGECDRVSDDEYGDLGEAQDGADGQAKDGQAKDGQAKDGQAKDGQADGEELGPRAGNEDGTTSEAPSEDELAQLGPLKVPPPPPADPFGLKSFFSSALSSGYGQSLYLGFKGIFGLFW